MASKSDPETYATPEAVIIQAPAWGINTPPLALGALTAYARRNGRKILPIDLNIESYLRRGGKYDDKWALETSSVFWHNAFMISHFISDRREFFDEFVDGVIETGTKLVGFVIYSSSYEVSVFLSREIKMRNPEITIVFGGPHASRAMVGKQIAGLDSVDLVAQGEGELILIEIMNAVRDGRARETILGTLARRNGVIDDPGDPDVIDDLDSLPYVDFTDFDFQKYHEPFRLPLMSSRGCLNDCNFCNEVTYWRKYRYFSAVRLVDEIASHLERYPWVSFIDFQDSVVNGSVREIERFAELVIERGLKFRWAGQAIIRKQMTLELFKKLKASGCICLAYGLETPSVELMLKNGKNAAYGVDVDKLVREAHEAGLTCSYNFMFGLPGETEEHAEATLDFVRRNRRYLATVNPSPSFCGFSQGTPGYDEPEKWDMKMSDKDFRYWEGDGGRNNYLVRLERFEKFCALVKKLKIPTTYPARRLLDRDIGIANYHFFNGEHKKAPRWYRRWLRQNPEDQEARGRLDECLSILQSRGEREDGAFDFLERAGQAGRELLGSLKRFAGGREKAPVG